MYKDFIKIHFQAGSGAGGGEPDISLDFLNQLVLKNYFCI
jgi:hypothetical protein